MEIQVDTEMDNSNERCVRMLPLPLACRFLRLKAVEKGSYKVTLNLFWSLTGSMHSKNHNPLFGLR